MSPITQDPLLTFTRGLLSFFIGIFWFAFGAVVIGIGALLTVQRAKLVESVADADLPPSARWWVMAGVVGVAAALYLWIRFMMVLRKALISVNEEDPFVEENADRLARMGWIALAIQGIVIPLGIGAKLAKEASEGESVTLAMDGGGLMLVLTLFILSRIFKRGAEMRAELEGTV